MNLSIKANPRLAGAMAAVDRCRRNREAVSGVLRGGGARTMSTLALGALVVFGSMFAVGTGIRGMGVLLRRRAAGRIPAPQRTREVRGIRVRGQVDGPDVLPGMNPGRSNVTTADLVLSEDRFVLASERGLLIDVGTSRGVPLGSARCTGPGRLVIEGDVPRMTGAPGRYRLEMALDDAEAWAADLARFVPAGEERAKRLS
jgi:hypothetical protein